MHKSFFWPHILGMVLYLTGSNPAVQYYYLFIFIDNFKRFQWQQTSVIDMANLENNRKKLEKCVEITYYN